MGLKRSNPLYHFLFRVFLVLVILTSIWIVGIFFYFEEQMAHKIHENINSKNKQDIEFFTSIDFKKQNKQYHEFLEFLDTESKKTQQVYVQIFDENKQLLINKSFAEYPKKAKEFVQRESKTVDELTYFLIPISSNEAYFYFQDKIKLAGKSYYLNTLKKVEQDYLTTLKDETFYTIFVVIISILVIAISIFPIIYSQYKKLLIQREELLFSNLGILTSLGNAVAKRDSDTNEHNYRVTYYSLKIAQVMNLSSKQVLSLIKGAFLHDIGKIAISDNILLKPGSFTKDEFEIMKTHVEHGVDIIKDVPWLNDAKKVILFHHEKVDGSGYPNGVLKDDIPIESRIFAVADVFDALSSKRPYKEAFDIYKSFEILKSDSNKHFDKDVVDAFELIYEKVYYDISGKDSQELKRMFEKLLKPYFVDSI